MNIQIDKTLKQIENYCLKLDDAGRVDIKRLHKGHDLSLKLQSQFLGVIYDRETFALDSDETRIAAEHSHGENSGDEAADRGD